MKEAQSYMTLLMLLPMVPTIVLMVSPVKTQLWQFAVPFLAQNQMLLKVIRGEAIGADGVAGVLRRGLRAGRAAVVRGDAALPPGAVGDLGLRSA